ncbi:hypothetical protein [Streptomyces sp. NBC_01264]|uniref:hypothetical protein n=1 Tax=Streptomyces sp. NBC_01264 TaxID=2903804 RepID=UPI00225514CB|nr:hypothetical protein [Streptomyces sp. NBC_01264]MCX4779691.1 hypothetical protein [Streptomyces sp. NBC_01264]
MTYARALRWTAGAALATAALLITAPAQAAASASVHGFPAVAAAGDVSQDRVFEDLAGSSAGAGRERPGRPVGEPANPETVLAARPVPAHPRTEPVPAIPAEPTATPLVGALGTQPNERAADLAAHILPLGTGFTLMGLGLGFMGMRLRRGM